MRYVLLGKLSGIGGWQLYMEARAEHLRRIGADISLISVTAEKYGLNTFSSFSCFNCPELHMPPASYSPRQQRAILQELRSFLGEKTETPMIIESTDIHSSMWGELLAEYYEAKNFSFLLHSHFHDQNRQVQDFFYFKYSRDELYGMSELTLPALFAGREDLGPIEPRALDALMHDAITLEDTLPAEVEKLKALKAEGAYIVGYFGHLSKPHFAELCDFIQSFAQRHGNRKFVFVSIGSSDDSGPEKKQMKISKTALNCSTINIPAVYPVPKSLFDSIDLCVASWGCAISASRTGCTTLRLLDDVTILPLGIMNIHITSYKDAPCKESLEELFENALLGRYEETHKVPFVSTYREELFLPMDGKVWGAPFIPGYYDVLSIQKVSKRSQVEKIMNRTLGVKITRVMINKLKPLVMNLYLRGQKKDTYAK